MESEPNKTMDEMLKANAQARRAEFGADPQMPNPMRARLHDEIARRNTDEAQRTTRGFGFWFPRLASAVAVAAVLIGVSVLMFEPKDNARVADANPVTNNAPREAAPAQAEDALTAELSGKSDLEQDNVAAATTEVPGKPADIAMKDRDGSDEATRALGGSEVTTKAKQAVAKSAPMAAAPALSKEKTEEAFQAAASTSLEGSAIASAAKAAPDSAGLRQFTEVRISPAPVLQGGVNANTGQNLFKGAMAPATPLSQNQNFRQVTQNADARGARFNSQLQRAVRVLNNFQVEQKGTQIRIVDGDGSTYTGKIEAIAQNDSRSVAKKQLQAPAGQSYAARAAAPRADEQANTAEFRFNASGYNDSLRKRVVFEGNYIVPRGQETGSQATNSAQKKDESQARIVGTARVSGESPISVDAVAVTQ